MKSAAHLSVGSLLVFSAPERAFNQFHHFSSQILSKVNKHTVFSEWVGSGTSCCCWILHKMFFFWASEIVPFILLRWLQKSHRRKNMLRSLRSADSFGGISWYSDDWWAVGIIHLAEKHTFNGSSIAEVKNSLFFYITEIFEHFLTVCVQINWIQWRPLGVQEIVMSFVQHYYLTF